MKGGYTWHIWAAEYIPCADQCVGGSISSRLNPPTSGSREFLIGNRNSEFGGGSGREEMEHPLVKTIKRDAFCEGQTNTHKSVEAQIHP